MHAKLEAQDIRLEYFQPRTNARLLALDPLTPASRWLGGWLACYDGAFEDSLSASRQWVLEDPSNPFVRTPLAFELLLLGHVEAARIEVEWVRDRMEASDRPDDKAIAYGIARG